MKRTFIYIAVIFLGSFLTSFSFAQAAEDNIERAAFFGGLADLPLMDGLVELSDQTVFFDKAAGRIVEVVAAVESQFYQEIRAYYADVLPQLGWVAQGGGVNGDVYVRGSERLQMSFERVEDERFVRFRVSPL